MTESFASAYLDSSNLTSKSFRSAMPFCTGISFQFRNLLLKLNKEAFYVS
jgi:hypothetical protein